MKYNICSKTGCFGSEAKNSVPNAEKLNKNHHRGNIFASMMIFDLGGNAFNIEGHFQAGYRSNRRKSYSEIQSSVKVPQIEGPVIKQIEGPPKETTSTETQTAKKTVTEIKEEQPVVIGTKTEEKEDEKAEGEVAL